MSIEKIAETLEGLLTVLEAAQFKNGSLDITLRGPENEWDGGPLKMIVDIRGTAVTELGAELSGVAVALSEIADAIREVKK